MHHLLKQQNVRLWLVYFVVFPAKTLRQILSIYNVLPSIVHTSIIQHTCVIPSPLHSSSHSSFKVPLAPSK